MRTVQILSMLVLSAHVAGAAPTALGKAEANAKANIRAQIRKNVAPPYKSNAIKVAFTGTPKLSGKHLAGTVQFWASGKAGLVWDGIGNYQYGKAIKFTE